MSETKFTPGPWILEKRDNNEFRIVSSCSWAWDIATVDNDVNCVLGCNSNAEGISLESIANAKLIAASPDMFTELSDTHEHLLRLYTAINNRSMDFEAILQELRDRMTKQRIVIEKATN